MNHKQLEHLEHVLASAVLEGARLIAEQIGYAAESSVQTHAEIARARAQENASNICSAYMSRSYPVDVSELVDRANMAVGNLKDIAADEEARRL